MTISVTLTLAGLDTGPIFNLYSNVDSFATAFDTGILKSVIQAGYTTLAPSGTTVVRIYSPGACDTYIDVPVVDPSSTTTTTSTSSTSTTSTTSSTTTTTTTVAPTTTTTTTATPINYAFGFQIVNGNDDATMFLNNRPIPIPSFKTSYTLVLVNQNQYQLGGNSIVCTNGKIIDRIQKYDYLNNPTGSPILVNSSNFTFSSFQMVLDSLGNTQYDTVKVFII